MRTGLLLLVMSGLVLAGCSTPDGDADGDGLSDSREAALGSDPNKKDTDGDGLRDGAEADTHHTDPTKADTDGDGVADAAELKAHSDPLAPPLATFRVSEVGQDGPEPSIGITGSGCIYFVALSHLMQSCDHANSWQELTDPLIPTTTSDPYLWVDPVTNRIFDIQMGAPVAGGTTCTQIAWSDDDGADWRLNPADCGTYPMNDHIKVATGPWTAAGYGQIGTLTSGPIYSQATYFCHNIPGVYCYTSFDGGMTFPVGAGGLGDTTSAGGLHGAIATAPDGTVYVTPRLETPTVAYSKDNGFSFTIVEMGKDVGTPDPRKNSEVAADADSNAYHTWIGKDARVYMARSTDSGVSWDAASTRVSPDYIVSSTFPHIQAGSPGRIAIAYLGSEDASLLGTDDIDGDPWEGNPHVAPEGVTYRLYVTFSLDALNETPTWTTIRITDDPVQAGSICISSGDCRIIEGTTASNRNLLDFNDLSLDRDGRIYIAFADGCRDECAQDASPEAKDSRSRMGMVALLESGPSLFAEKGQLTPFP